MVLCGPRTFIVLATLEPMRYLQLVYIFLFLIGGALLGGYVLESHPARWAVFLVLMYLPMFDVQRALFPSTPHLEFPGHASANPWLQAFAWIRTHTPPDAYFALGPGYLTRPGEDMHSFRALAERSTLADNLKDRSVLSKAPQLVAEWQLQVNAQPNWAGFQIADFQRLTDKFGVDWLILDREPPPGLPCPWNHRPLFVCQIPRAVSGP
jgi:hypothetical protein